MRRTFQRKLKLLEECKVIPNLDHLFHYEIYHRKSSIGFKVENICFILFRDASLKVVSQDQLKKKSGTIYSTGRILFKEAFKVLDQCSDKDDISVSDCLVSKMQNSWSIWNYLSLYWSYFISFLQFTPRDSLSSSPFTPDISKSKKMPENEEFLEVFQKKCDALCECDVIVNYKQQKKYKIAKFTTEERRHAMIIISGPKHAFVLEMSCRRFKKNIHNCPDIRYISDENLEKMPLFYNTIEKSADELVQIAIETLSKMGDYDILMNNCQNFVKNYFCALGINNSSTNLEGEIVNNVMYKISSPIPLCITIYLLLIIHSYYDYTASEYHPLMVNIVLVIIVILFLSLLYINWNEALHNFLTQIIVLYILNVSFNLFKKNVAIFHIFILSLLILIFRVARLGPFIIFFSFTLLASLVCFIAYYFLSVSMLTSLAMAFYTVTFGAWMAVGKSWNREYIIILPCSVTIILYIAIFTKYRIYILFVILLFLCFKKPKLKRDFILLVLLILGTIAVAMFCIKNSDKDMPYTYFIFNSVLISLSLLKIIIKN